MFRPGRRAIAIAVLALAAVSLAACGGLPGGFGGFTTYAPYGARYGGPNGRGAAPPFGSGWSAAH